MMTDAELRALIARARQLGKIQFSDTILPLCDALEARLDDARWNAAVDASLEAFFAQEMDDIPLFAQHAVCSRDMQVASAIRALKKGPHRG